MDGKELEMQFKLGSEIARFKVLMAIKAYLLFSGILNDYDIAKIFGLDLTERDAPDWFKRGRQYATRHILKESGG